MRRDKCFIGAEKISLSPDNDELFVELAAFMLIGISCVVFFLAHPGLLEEYFKFRTFKALLGVFIFLVLSPFGSHLAASCLGKILTKLKCAILNYVK